MTYVTGSDGFWRFEMLLLSNWDVRYICFDRQIFLSLHSLGGCSSHLVVGRTYDRHHLIRTTFVMI